MTKDEANIKAGELSAKLGKKVHCLFVSKGEEIIVGFLQEPTLRTKMAAMNSVANQQMDKAGEAILNASLIIDESDERLTLTGSDPNVYVSACLACVQFVEVYEVE